MTGTSAPGGLPPPRRDTTGPPNRRSPRIGELAGAGPLYPEVYYASLPAVAALRVSDLAAAARHPPQEGSPARSARPAGPGRGPYPAAQLIVSLDPPERFDPELSMREPLELQVWPDGSVTVEIEFSGDDIRAVPGAGEVLRAVLAEWADARSWRLDAVYNDRGRSLPDIWNARFVMPDTSTSVGSAVAFAGRAIAAAESQQTGGHTVERLLELLRAGDAHALPGAPATAVFQGLPGPPPADEAGRFGLASEVCGFANSVRGGLLVLGLDPASATAGNRAGVRPFAIGDGVACVTGTIRSLVFPEPAGLIIENVPAIPAGPPGDGLIAVAVPPQDRILKPFLVHGTLVEGRYQAQFASIVERRDATIYAQPIAALHAQIAAGRALLRRGPEGEDD